MILCKLFGHRLPLGWGGGRPYLKIYNVTTDGIGRRHAMLEVNCDRCEELWHIANVHLPKERGDG